MLKGFKAELIQHRGIDIHAHSLGSGPLVVFCHGFPGHWSHWQHQMQAVADSGFKAIALDMRGYGSSSRPVAIEDYDMNQQIADLIAVLDHFNSSQAVFIGQDFGAALVWNMALRHPQQVAAVIGISVPFDFDYYGRSCLGHLSHEDIRQGDDATLLVASPLNAPSVGFKAIAEHQFFHAQYFQKKGIADKELGNNARLFLSRLYWALSAEGDLGDWSQYPGEGTAYLDVLPSAPDLPWPWLSIEAMEQIQNDYMRLPSTEAFSGGLASYRVADRNWAIGEPFKADNIKPPALFIAGQQDPIMAAMDDEKLKRMQSRMDDCRGILLIEDAGHFVQLEQAEKCSKPIIEFLNKLLNFN